MSLFKLKQKSDEFAYGVFNFLSDVFFNFKKPEKKLLKLNSKFKNIHKNERCFILGTGPSLNRLSNNEIDKLSGEMIFGVNSLYKAPRFEKINPDYYALIDNNYWGISSGTFEEVFSKYEDNPPVFITDYRALSVFPKNADGIFLYAKNYPINSVRFDLTGNVSIAMNVIGVSILSAMYMGFKEIYLLGCDYNSFCSKSGTHCYDDSLEAKELPQYNLAFYLKYYAITTDFHYLIFKTASQLGVRVINLSEGSLLDAYPHKSIKDVI